MLAARHSFCSGSRSPKQRRTLALSGAHPFLVPTPCWCPHLSGAHALLVPTSFWCPPICGAHLQTAYLHLVHRLPLFCTVLKLLRAGTGSILSLIYHIMIAYMRVTLVCASHCRVMARSLCRCWHPNAAKAHKMCSTCSNAPQDPTPPWHPPLRSPAAPNLVQPMGRKAPLEGTSQPPMGSLRRQQGWACWAELPVACWARDLGKAHLIRRSARHAYWMRAQ